ncbi:MAG: glycosyltransferase family 4 protein [Candidatus Buchananbacteria bacterium]
MTENIKKTLLVTLDFPPNLGGVATYYYNLCKNLPADKIVVLAPNQPGAEEFDQKQNFAIIRKNLIKDFPQTWPSGFRGVFKIIASVKWLTLIRQINLIAKHHKIELIQAGQVLPIGTLAWLYWRKKGVPYIFYAHGLDIMLPQKFMRKKTLLKKIIENAKAIVANSYFTKDELIKLGAAPEKVKVIYPCPDSFSHQTTEWKNEKIIQDYKLTDKKILLTVGRLVERKGHDQVILALPKIIKQVPNLVYLIAGAGPQKPVLQNLVDQNGLRDVVKFIGQASKEELTIFYQICDVFIMPSRQLENGDVEGFGIVYLEANSFGKPVIGGKSGGVPEAIIDGKTGLLVNPENTDQIAQAVIKLLTDQSYAHRLGLQGLERVSNEFDWLTQAQKLKSLLK